MKRALCLEGRRQPLKDLGQIFVSEAPIGKTGGRNDDKGGIGGLDGGIVVVDDVQVVPG